MIKVYICSSCRKENFDYVTELMNKHNLHHHGFFFRPQPGQLLDKETFANTDVKAIQECDEVWLIGDYGRDCSWELGYAAGIGKPVRIFVCKVNKNKIEQDWMITANVNKTITEVFDESK